MTFFVFVIVFWLGYYLREVLHTLNRIAANLQALRNPEKKEKNDAKFAEPMSRAEFIAEMEQERIDALNK